MVTGRGSPDMSFGAWVGQKMVNDFKKIIEPFWARSEESF